MLAGNQIRLPVRTAFIPALDYEALRSPYDTQTPAAAGNLISTDLLSDRFIDQLYNQSAFLSMGVTYMRDLTGNVEIPREELYS